MAQEEVPIIAFINGKSGGNQGIKLLSKLQEILGNDRVYDLGEGGPSKG
jgi:diacylglycerol kinase (ATP)